jgi:DNA mismatch repair protein MLH1
MVSVEERIEIVYAAHYLKQPSLSYIYISIVLPPENIDVNMHPTKREVKT